MVAERVADGVLVVGGIEPADERISWTPAVAGRTIPINSYLVVEGAGCVIIDSGLPAHEEIVLAGLEAISAAVQHMKLVITRGVEFDSIGNLTAILRAQPVEAVFSHFPSAPWFRLDPRFEADDDGARREAATPFYPLAVDEAIPVAAESDRLIDVLEPAMRLLQTAWLYDERSGTLFTSDAFGYVLMATGAQSRVVDEDHDRTSLADVEAGLKPKFGWLADAEVTTTYNAIRATFTELDVQVIAPTIGCVLRGRSVVRRHVAMVLEVLDRWGRQHAV
jgi:flavorubredoxin